MGKKIIFLLGITIFLGMFSMDVSAQSIDFITNAFSTISGLLFKIAIGIAFLLLVIAGFYYVAAQGEPANIEKAKKIILWTIVGLIIATASKAIITYITNKIK